MPQTSAGEHDARDRRREAADGRRGARPRAAAHRDHDARTFRSSSWCTRADSFVGASLRPPAPSRNPRARCSRSSRPGDVVVDAGANLGAHLVPLAVAVADGRHAPVSDAGRLSRSSRRRRRMRSSTRVCAGLGAHPERRRRVRAPPARKTGESRQSRRWTIAASAELGAQLSLVGRARRPDADEYENYTVARRRGDQKLSWRHPTRRSMSTQVPVRSIDSVLKEMSLACPSLIKVDVEGQEDDALRGAAKTIKNAGLSLYVREQPLRARPDAAGATAGVAWLRRLPPARSPTPRSGSTLAQERRRTTRVSAGRSARSPAVRRVLQPALAGLPETTPAVSCPAGNPPSRCSPPDLLRLPRPRRRGGVVADRGRRAARPLVCLSFRLVADRASCRTFGRSPSSSWGVPRRLPPLPSR